MISQWCTTAQVLDQVPEFQSDSQAGVLPTATIDRMIEQATYYARCQITGRYLLSVIEAGLTAGTLTGFQFTVAMQAAVLLLIRYNLGTNADKRIDSMRIELADAYSKLAHGTLYYDDGTLVPTRNTPSSVATIEDNILDLYVDGDRYAQPTT